MATTVSGVSVKVTQACTTEKTVDLASTKDVLNQSYAQTYTHGTGSGAINKAWHDTRPLTPSQADTLDLSGLTDPFGETVNYSTLKSLFIKNEGTTQITVGGAGSNPLVVCFTDGTDEIVIPAGGHFSWCGGDAGVALGAGVNLTVTNDNTGTAGEYDIILMGVSA